MLRVVKYVFLIGLAIFIIIQFVPVNRENPKVDSASTLQAPESVHSVLKRSCYDCHSNETQWPIYSYVAPVSWLVAHDVHEGREHLNFSIWNEYPPEARTYFKGQMIREIEAEGMPLPIYLIMHRDARIQDTDFDTLKNWAEIGDIHTD